MIVINFSREELTEEQKDKILDTLSGAKLFQNVLRIVTKFGSEEEVTQVQELVSNLNKDQIPQLMAVVTQIMIKNSDSVEEIGAAVKSDLATLEQYTKKSGNKSGTSVVFGDNTGQNVGVNRGNMVQTNQNIHNTSPNRGAQGTFNHKVAFNQTGQRVMGQQINAAGNITGASQVITGNKASVYTEVSGDDAAVFVWNPIKTNTLAEVVEEMSEVLQYFYHQDTEFVIYFGDHVLKNTLVSIAKAVLHSKKVDIYDES